MAVGFTKDGAVQDQIDDTVNDAVALIRNSQPRKVGCKFCMECGTEIPEKRREALIGVMYCITCQTLNEAPMGKSALFTTFNRRGSKDSQLR